jgi:hypothetical protein
MFPRQGIIILLLQYPIPATSAGLNGSEDKIVLCQRYISQPSPFRLCVLCSGLIKEIDEFRSREARDTELRCESANYPPLLYLLLWRAGLMIMIRDDDEIRSVDVLP